MTPPTTAIRKIPPTVIPAISPLREGGVGGEGGGGEGDGGEGVEERGREERGGKREGDEREEGEGKSAKGITYSTNYLLAQ